MLSVVHSAGLIGLDGYIVEVEADISAGIPAFDIVGLPDLSVRESKERVRSALKNCGFEFPVKRITLNLAPANLKKEGPLYDLPITIALLSASGQIENIDHHLFIGELSLDGRLRPIPGVLPMVMSAAAKGIKKVFLPAGNACEAAVVSGIEVYGANNLVEIVDHLMIRNELSRTTVNMEEIFQKNNNYVMDFSDVKGQEDVKRAVEIAVAGGHNILLIGSPGAGKSMIAQRIPTILPDLSFEEALEVTRIHSIAGTLPQGSSLVTTRPFRHPHHTISATGLSGGGAVPRPGELSLSHNGVLFLDELPEFHRDVLEVMRQPLEDGHVTISRVAGTLTYPCNTLFAASMNPCKCGYFGDVDHECNCTLPQVIKYRNRISGPLLDRIDIHVEVPSVKYNDLSSETSGETSTQIRERVNRAREIQRNRYKDLELFSNSSLSPSSIKKYCKLNEESNRLLKVAFENMGLSARAHSRILKVARTIADLDESTNILTKHIAEAIQYRSLDRSISL